MLCHAVLLFLHNQPCAQPCAHDDALIMQMSSSRMTIVLQTSLQTFNAPGVWLLHANPIMLCCEMGYSLGTSDMLDMSPSAQVNGWKWLPTSRAQLLLLFSTSASRERQGTARVSNNVIHIAA